jgi:hypothetical protein
LEVYPQNTLSTRTPACQNPLPNLLVQGLQNNLALNVIRLSRGYSMSLRSFLSSTLFVGAALFSQGGLRADGVHDFQQSQGDSRQARLEAPQSEEEEARDTFEKMDHRIKEEAKPISADFTSGAGYFGKCFAKIPSRNATRELSSVLHIYEETEGMYFTVTYAEASVSVPAPEILSFVHSAIRYKKLDRFWDTLSLEQALKNDKAISYVQSMQRAKDGSFVEQQITAEEGPVAREVGKRVSAQLKLQKRIDADGKTILTLQIRRAPANRLKETDPVIVCEYPNRVFTDDRQPLKKEENKHAAR